MDATPTELLAIDPNVVVPNGDPLDRVPLGEQIGNFLAIGVPFAGFAITVALLWGHGFGWAHCIVFISMYLITGMGITVGYHRLFCHRAFKTNRVVQCLLAISGSMAFEGSVLTWVAMHRCHHQHSDRPGDPHSPHHGGEGFWGIISGMWHAHMGWILKADPKNLTRYIPDLQTDRLLRVVGRLWMLWAFLGLLAPAVLGGLLTHSWMGFLLGFLWGGLARIFLVHHMTWSVNSICHIWGSRPYDCHDHSRNNFLFGIISLGEGWHNNHHAFPTSARHGLRWWQFDVSYGVIVLMSWLGLAWDVKVPQAQRMSGKMLNAA